MVFQPPLSYSQDNATEDPSEPDESIKITVF
jgi:hypothetical protein